MKNIFLFLTAFILTFNIVAISKAQTIERAQNSDSGSELFLRYISNNKEYNTQLRSKLNRLFHITFEDCKTIDSIQRLKPEIILTPAFRGSNLTRNTKSGRITFNDLHPTFGQWIDKNIVKGCGKTTQLNLLATAYDLKKKPEIFPTLNGQTRVEIIDQANAEKVVAKKINDELGCFDSVFVLGSRFLGYKKATDKTITKNNENSGWYERWVVEACNNYHRVNLAILPDAKTRFEFIAQIAKEEG